MRANTEVLVVGAGPTGLVLALWLKKLGVQPRIIDKAAEPGTTSRALAVQARTLELYAQAGIASEVVAQGRMMAAVDLWVRGKKAARAVFGDLGKGVSPYPYPLIFPQDEHERLLIDRLAEAGVQVERSTELLGLECNDDCVVATVRRPDGTTETCETAYLAGCDGAHSVVREQLGIGFPGGTYSHLFYVADIEGSGEAVNGEINVGLDRADFLAVFPLKQDGHARLVGTVRDDAGQPRESLAWSDVSRNVVDWMRIDVRQVHWFSTYRVHHRVADQFHGGRAFLIGDAAHIHSPVGGQGMNTGIGDAVNIAWKLAAVLRGRATPSLLDTYEPERIAFARRLVATTDRAFTAVSSTSAFARFVRLDIVPVIVPIAFSLPAVRRLLFRTVSQTNVHYRESRLSEGRAGGVHGGDRLPWVPGAAQQPDNFAPLRSMDWQVHVYGEASPELRAWCSARALPLHEFEWRGERGATGIERDAVYLVRPDGYVALAGAPGGLAALSSYAEARGLRFAIAG